MERVSLEGEKYLSVYSSKVGDLKNCCEDLIYGEERIQLLESCEYDYVLPSGYRFNLYECPKGIVKEFKGSQAGEMGRLKPGIYVGRLPLIVTSPAGHDIEVAFEVRSKKIDYRSDYRTMLEEITRECTELITLHSSAVTQRFAVNYEVDSKTVYQRFAFLKTIVDTEEFVEAINRIVSAPVTSWNHYSEDVDIRRVRRVTPRQARQLSSRGDRLATPKSHPLASIMTTVPRRVSVHKKNDTVDTPENRFVKHVLEEFCRFAAGVSTLLDKRSNHSRTSSLCMEAKQLQVVLENHLSHSLFKEISNPDTMPLNSPILQRKEGYREVLKYWLMYDLAAKLVWSEVGGEDYQMGKRDVAALYEYWIFFKLLRVVEDVFGIAGDEIQDLIKETPDGMSLQLKSGRHTALKGLCVCDNGRELQVQFSFNRTFSSQGSNSSWTKSMRPDYTLSLWPSSFSESEAEEQEVMVHVHFDAKYKVDGLEYLVDNHTESEEDETTGLDEIKYLEKSGTYKRADLLKMHAYKDAIRRTVGAYVLYPGKGPPSSFKEYHEITPGLGAFAISPASETSADGIKSFLIDLKNHVSSRASQQERISYYGYSARREEAQNLGALDLPEKSYGKRMEPPSDMTVLVGFCNHSQRKWVEGHHKYNICLEPGGKLSLDNYSKEIIGAKWLLLHQEGKTFGRLLEIKEGGPRCVSSEDLVKVHRYPRNPSCANYLIFDLVEKDDGEESFQDIQIDLKAKLAEFQLEAYNSGRPFSMSVSELFSLQNE